MMANCKKIVDAHNAYHLLAAFEEIPWRTADLSVTCSKPGLFSLKNRDKFGIIHRIRFILMPVNV